MINFYCFVLFLSISMGISCIWSLSDIFMKPRNIVAKHFPAPLRKMLLCMECSSFWIGCIVSIFIFPLNLPVNEFIQIPLIDVLCGGIVTHVFVKIFNNYKVFEK